MHYCFSCDGSRSDCPDCGGDGVVSEAMYERQTRETTLAGLEQREMEAIVSELGIGRQRRDDEGCSLCGAASGAPCVNVFSGDKAPLVYSHQQPKGKP